MSDESPRPGENPEDRSETDVHRTRFTVGIDEPSTVVVRAVAALTDRTPLELPPLAVAIDPDALDGLFQRTEHGRYRGADEVTFTYDDHEVAVRRSGEITVRSPGGGE